MRSVGWTMEHLRAGTTSKGGMPRWESLNSVAHTGKPCEKCKICKLEPRTYSGPRMKTATCQDRSTGRTVYDSPGMKTTWGLRGLHLGLTFYWRRNAKTEETWLYPECSPGLKLNRVCGLSNSGMTTTSYMTENLAMRKLNFIIFF